MFHVLLIVAPYCRSPTQVSTTQSKTAFDHPKEPANEEAACPEIQGEVMTQESLISIHLDDQERGL